LRGRTFGGLGREIELAQILRELDAVDREGRARVVSVGAVSGLGKSRLADAFALEAAARGLVVLRAEGRVVDGGTAAPLSAVSEMLRRSTGIELGGPRAKAYARLLSAATDAGAPEPPLIAAFLGEIAGVGFPSSASPTLGLARRDARVMGDQMRRAFEAWLEGVARKGLLAIVVDDAHAVDELSVAILCRALRRLAQRKVFLVVLGAPHVDGLFDVPGVPRARLSLEPLGAERAARGEALTPDVVERIVRRSDGNLAVLEELLRGGEGDAAFDLDRALSARVRDLEEAPRRFLVALAVLGGTRDALPVARVAGLDVGARQVSALLDRLVAVGLVVDRGEGLVAVRHSKVAEAALATAVGRELREAHARAAEWLREADIAADADIAAHERALGNVEAAHRHLVAATRRALSSNDFASALAIARRAEADGAKGRLLGELCLLAAEAHRWSGAHADAAREADRATALLEAGSDAWYAALGESGLAAGRLGHQDRLARVVMQLRVLPAKLGDEARRRLRSVSAMAAIHLVTCGRVELARGLLADLEAGAETDDAFVRARRAQARAFDALFDGDLGAYFRGMGDAVRLFEEAGDVREACLQGVNLGNAAAQIGAYEEAEEALEISRRRAEELGLANVVAYADHNLGIALLHLGRTDEALRVEARARSAFAASGDKRMQGVSAVYLAMIHLVRGETTDAVSAATSAVELLERSRPAKACALATLSAAELGQATEAGGAEALTLLGADAHSSEALSIVEELGGIEEGEALVRLMRAEVLRATGRDAEARAVLAVAKARIEARAERLGDPEWRRSFKERVPENRRTLELADR
jgi:tetratricopeptide (TPR) repeat protein